MRHQTRFLLCAAVMASMVTAPAAFGADTLYKWVDKNGNVTYQDEPPPGNSGRVQTLVEQTPEAVPPKKTVPDVPVVLYSIKDCASCDMLRKLLKDRGIPFQEKNANANVKVQTELKKVAGLLTVPVLTIGDHVFKGYNEALILYALRDAGFPTDVQTSAGRKQTEANEQASQPGATDIAGAGGGLDAPGSRDSTFSESNIFSEDKSDNASRSGNAAGPQEIPKDEQIQVSQ